MSTKILFPLALVFGLLAAALALPQTKRVSPQADKIQTQTGQSEVELASEKHLRRVRQLTFGGENAEAYFSGDGRQLIFQSKRDGRPCDQIYEMNADGSNVRMVSTGRGRTTCSYFFPDGRRILFSSTHLASPDCPPSPDYSHGYVWAIYPGYDIFTARPDGSDLKQLTTTPGYDAEATFSVDGRKIVFTSMRDGDLDIYTMDADGRNVKRLTNELGYDGGPFFSRDGRKIVYRANHPQTPAEAARYKQLLAQNLIEPNVLEIWVMDADGSHKRQVTHLGAASFAPYLFPDGRRIIFSSNYPDVRSRDFNLFAVNTDGTGLEQITFHPSFDGFPMFSPDGRELAFASNRNGRVRGETNVFIADWVEVPSGDLKVTVYDPVRAVVVKAKVIIEGRDFKGVFETDEVGEAAVRLPAGVYQISVDALGFQTFTRAGVRVRPGSAQKLDADLKIRPPESLVPARAAP
ncbi:MAG TPA: carboxypeptidase regulatory-like domain-containing protein [Pyrinomonadaceae bacterium]|nr:carboxypeptidase regulatory-like domain-containing protein [Pyrinomonadaceae bacterium]